MPRGGGGDHAWIALAVVLTIVIVFVVLVAQGLSSLATAATSQGPATIGPAFETLLGVFGMLAVVALLIGGAVKVFGIGSIRGRR